MLYAEQDLASEINFYEPKRGDSLWVTRRVEWIKGAKRNRRAQSWHVTREEPGTVQRQNELPMNAQADAPLTDEAERERDLRQSHQIVKDRVETNAQVKENLAQVPEIRGQESALVRESLAIERKPAATETRAAQSAQGQPRTQLEAALKTVLYACKQATAYAREIEYQAPPFTSDDIARMAMTLVIGKEQRR